MPVAAPVIGAVGGIAGAAISKPKKQKDPYAFIRDDQNYAADQARNLYAQGGPQVYEGSTIAPMSGTTQDALQQQIARAQGGSPLIDSAQGFVQQGLQTPVQSGYGVAQNPYAASVGGGAMRDPYARPVNSGSAYNPYSASVGGGASGNPFSASVGGGASGNPYGGVDNPYGEGRNPGLDAAFDYAAQKSRGAVESEFARAGRNIGASAPVRSDMLSSLAAQIYAPAYEAERNRELSFDQQRLGIGAQGFESAQARAQNAALQGQQIGAQGFESAQGRNLQARLAGQQIGAQTFDNAQSRQLQAGLAGQQIGSAGFQAGQNRSLQAGLAGQQIGAQGYENAQQRQLADIQSQRQQQLGMLGFASPLAAQDYQDIAQLRDAGSVYDQYGQAQLSDQVNQFNQQQQRPYQNMQQLIGSLSSLSGSTGQLPQQTPRTDYLSAGLGGALLGQQLFGRNQYQTPAANISPDQALAYSLGGLF